MNQVVLGLSITVIGCLIVLAGLAMIIGGAILMKNARKEKAVAIPQSRPADHLPAVLSAAVAATLEQEEQERLIAVLTAAVAAMWEENQGGFVVRKVRRIHNSPAWQKAGREEQIYSRM